MNGRVVERHDHGLV